VVITVQERREQAMTLVFSLLRRQKDIWFKGELMRKIFSLIYLVPIDITVYVFGEIVCLITVGNPSFNGRDKQLRKCNFIYRRYGYEIK
jgi:hypothetical protein